MFSMNGEADLFAFVAWNNPRPFQLPQERGNIEVEKRGEQCFLLFLFYKK